MQLNEVKALITGGVSGLGLAVARKVVSSGGQYYWISMMRPVPLSRPNWVVRSVIFEPMSPANRVSWTRLSWPWIIWV